jgi:hypothetical protein
MYGYFTARKLGFKHSASPRASAVKYLPYDICIRLFRLTKCFILQILMKQQMSNFLTYRAENFESITNSAEEIANILDVDPVFPKIPKKKKKIKFDYEANDEQIINPKDNIKKK